MGEARKAKSPCRGERGSTGNVANSALSSITRDSRDSDRNLTEHLLYSATSEVDGNTGRHEKSSLPPRRGRTTHWFKAVVVVAVLPMFLSGYSISVLNAPESVIFPSHTIVEWSIAVSSYPLGGFVGANISGRLADRYGRRMLLLVTGYVYIAAGLLHILSPNISVLIIARLIVGVSGGAAPVLTPMYLSEISPKDTRGSIGTMTQLSSVVGIMASILLALPFNTETLWRFIFLPIPVIGLILVALGQAILKESPRWLLLNHYAARSQEARKTIRFFLECNDTEVEMEVERALGTLHDDDDTPPTDFPGGAESDDFVSGTVTPELDSECEHTKSFRTFVSDPKNRIPLFSSIFFAVAQQLCGINAVFYYSTSFFERLASDPHVLSIIAFAVNILGTIIGMLLMDRFGRRTLLSWSAGGMCICCIFLTLSLEEILPIGITVVAVMIYIIFFEIGLGCIPFFIATELIDPTFLGIVQSIAISGNFLANFCVGMLFPFMDKHLGSFSFVPFAVVLFVTLVYSIGWLPETRGKTYKEVMLELERRRTTGIALSLDPEATPG